MSKGAVEQVQALRLKREAERAAVRKRGPKAADIGSDQAQADRAAVQAIMLRLGASAWRKLERSIFGEVF